MVPSSHSEQSPQKAWNIFHETWCEYCQIWLKHPSLNIGENEFLGVIFSLCSLRQLDGVQWKKVRQGRKRLEWNECVEVAGVCRVGQGICLLTQGIQYILEGQFLKLLSIQMRTHFFFYGWNENGSILLRCRNAQLSWTDFSLCGSGALGGANTLRYIFLFRWDKYQYLLSTLASRTWTAARLWC